MEYMKAVTFTGLKYSRAGEDRSKESLWKMHEKTGCNTVVIVIGALQESAYSDYIDYHHSFMPEDEELMDFISYAVKMGLRVVLKPIINCKDGTWRAYINFFDDEVPCEPKWSTWFEHYTEYQLHYAAIAQESGCEMYIAGSEMVMSEKRETEWRELFLKIREAYHGLVSYNADKYQEDRVPFWDAVDVISSSGYYPIQILPEQLDRLGELAARYEKPFVFAECGCKSCEGASVRPNMWNLSGAVSMEEQAEYYRNFFELCRSREFIRGIAVWDWHNRLYPEENAVKDSGYCIYGKPACEIIRSFWT